MTIALSLDEIRYLGLLEYADKHGLSVYAPPPPGGITQLMEAGYVIDRAVSEDTGVPVITNSGKKALIRD